MGTTYRFLASLNESSVVLDWFRSLADMPIEKPHEFGSLFYFQGLGRFDAEPGKSPLVNVFLPVRKRGMLTTVGEVHFLAKPITAFPALNAIRKQFDQWLCKYPCVFSQRRDGIHDWDYYFEGSLRNRDSDIHALPNGMESLKRGDYFVANDDNNVRLDSLCRQLQLRGVVGIE